MNFLDKIISSLSPSAGLRRAAARAAIEEMQEARRWQNRYDGAKQDRSTADWFTTGASADSEIGAAMTNLRNKSRDFGRNNPFVSHAYELLAAKMVGTGVRPRLDDSVAPQIRDRTNDLWRYWVDECDADGLDDLYGLQRLIAKTVVESGEALIRFVPMPGTGRRIPYVIRVLEPDYIDHSRTYALPDEQGAVVLGVEYNRQGVRVAYHMFTEHPGADLFTRRRNANNIERVPAEQIAPVFWKTRPEQNRGVPWISPSIMLAKSHDDLNNVRLMRAKIQACFCAYVRKIPDATVISTDSTGKRTQQIQPGMIEYLLPEEDVSFGSPPQSEGDDDWQIMLLHAIAAGCGVTYAQLTGDLRQVNYSSIRAGTLDFWALLDSWQCLMLKPMMCRPIWRYFDTSAGALQSRLTRLNVEWDWPDRPFIDPEKDGNAVDASLLSGRRTFHEVISASGKDPEMHIAELKREREELVGLNLPHLTEALSKVQTVPPANGAAAADDTEEDQQPTDMVLQ
jgi:lambda family phage portal protein